MDDKILKIFFKKVLAAAVAPALCLFNGCGEGEITSHPLWLKGSKAEAAGDYAAAESIYAKLARIRPGDPAVHIKLAELNDERLNDPFRAAEEYAILLQIDPDHPEAAIYSKLLRRARRESCNIWLLDGSVPPPENALPGTGLDPVRELQLLRRENAILRYELREKREAVIPRQEVSAATQQPAQQQVQQPVQQSQTAAAEPAPAQQDFYTVISGDTPEGISRKIYGTTRYAGAILEANKDQVKSARGLQIGQRLRLPEIGEQ